MKKVLFLFSTVIFLILNVSCHKEDNYYKSSILGKWVENTYLKEKEELDFYDSDTLVYATRSDLKSVFPTSYIYRLDGDKLYLYPVDMQSESINCKFSFNSGKSKLFITGLWTNEPDETIEFVRQ